MAFFLLLLLPHLNQTKRVSKGEIGPRPYDSRKHQTNVSILYSICGPNAMKWGPASGIIKVSRALGLGVFEVVTVRNDLGLESQDQEGMCGAN
jgi:hypothetical protein